MKMRKISGFWPEVIFPALLIAGAIMLVTPFVMLLILKYLGPFCALVFVGIVLAILFASNEDEYRAPNYDVRDAMLASILIKHKEGGKNDDYPVG
jgi:hypothetical protein